MNKYFMFSWSEMEWICKRSHLRMSDEHKYPFLIYIMLTCFLVCCIENYPDSDEDAYGADMGRPSTKKERKKQEREAQRQVLLYIQSLTFRV